jgi:hypothetical protein
VNSSNQTVGPSDADLSLDMAIRLRRQQQLAGRGEPADSATGTSQIAARLAKARAEALTNPRGAEVVDLT